MKNDPELSTILFFAFRYALGRRSYAPSLVSEYISNNLDIFNTHSLEKMVAEIDEAKRFGGLGDAGIDEPIWLMFKEVLIEEINSGKS